MSPTHPSRLRQRCQYAYTALIALAAAGATLLWPAQWPGILLMALVSLAVAWLIAHCVTRHLRERFHALRETTEAISRGDLDRHIDDIPHDEFLKLAGSLDRLSGQLRATVGEQERLQERLTRTEKLALVGELAATVAHEINNPLDGLQNGVRIIRRNPDNLEQTRQLLDLMEAGLYRIEMIVRRLLAMSRDEPVHLLPVRVDELLEEAWAFVRPRLERHGIELVSEAPAKPVVVQADRAQLVQAIINMMLNAADAMPTGGKLVARYRVADEGRRVVLELSDTGAGIDAAHLPHIFEPFYTTKPKGSGTGLGLAVVARIIEAHHGRIEVASEPGRGTRFRIELPGVPASVPAAAKPEAVPVGNVTDRLGREDPGAGEVT